GLGSEVMARGSKASSMAEEKVVTEREVSVSSSHPSMNVLRGLGNLQGAPPYSGLVSSTSQRIGVLSSGELGGRDRGPREGALTGLGAPTRDSWVEKLAEQRRGLEGGLTERRVQRRGPTERQGISAVAPLRSLVLTAREKDWLGGFPLSPGLGTSPRIQPEELENLPRVRRHCCSAHLLRFLWRNLRGSHFSARRAAAESPLRGGASASSGPPPLVRLRACSTGSRLRQPLLFFLPVSYPVTPEVEVAPGRRPRRGRKAEAESEREAEPGELLL
ncbi:hypothetical protein EI555_004533, partial [Monodon monoceros]